MPPRKGKGKELPTLDEAYGFMKAFVETPQGQARKRRREQQQADEVRKSWDVDPSHDPQMIAEVEQRRAEARARIISLLQENRVSSLSRVILPPNEELLSRYNGTSASVSQGSRARHSTRSTRSTRNKANVNGQEDNSKTEHQVELKKLKDIEEDLDVEEEITTKKTTEGVNDEGLELDADDKPEEIEDDKPEEIEDDKPEEIEDDKPEEVQDDKPENDKIFGAKKKDNVPDEVQDEANDDEEIEDPPSNNTRTSRSCIVS